MTSAPTLRLNTGYEMPLIGLGVWQSKDGDEVRATEWALTHGYTHVDTAAIYKNEEGVGEGIRRSGIAREDLFLTTKVWLDDIRGGNTRQALETSLRKLGVDYVDLYLLHWKVDGGIAAYREMETLQAEGLIRSIGLSNYMPEHIEELRQHTDVMPDNNQVELHPYNQQRDVQAYCREHGIAVTAWSPLMQGKFLAESAFEEIGRPYGKTAAQVLLRWFAQKDLIAIPKSVHERRISENFDVFDFTLTAGEIERIDGLDKPDGRIGPDPRDFSF